MSEDARVQEILNPIQLCVRIVATWTYLIYISIKSSKHPFRDAFQALGLVVKASLIYCELLPTKKMTNVEAVDGLTMEARAEKEELSSLYHEARTTTDQQKALENYNRLVALNPSVYFGERAEFFLTQEKDELALADFNEAVKYDPDLWLSTRADYWGLRGDLERCVEDYRHLINLRSAAVLNASEDVTKKSNVQWKSHQLAETYWGRASMYELHKDFQSALADHQKAAEISKDYLERYAEFCQRRDFWKHYLTALNELVRQSPQNFLLRRAKFYSEHGEPEKAMVDFDEAVKVCSCFRIIVNLHSPRAWALKQRAEFMLQQGKTKEAERDTKQAERLARLQEVLFGFYGWPTEQKRSSRLWSDEDLRPNR